MALPTVIMSAVPMIMVVLVMAMMIAIVAVLCRAQRERFLADPGSVAVK
jgi:hypothetical protein